MTTQTLGIITEGNVVSNGDVILAMLNGKEVEYRYKHNGIWKLFDKADKTFHNSFGPWC